MNSRCYCLEIMGRVSKIVVPVMTNFTNCESRNISRSILSHHWNYQIEYAIVLFLRSNVNDDNDLHGSY